MQLPKSRVRWVACTLVGVILMAGCSKNEVKKAPTIPDSSQAELMQAGKGKKKRDSRGSQYDTLWDRLFALYALPPIDHPDIDRELSWFANHPGYLERAQNRAEPFLYSIVKLVEKKNVPGELALLPIVESAFQPHVVSPARAAGIWQFIPSTGTNYGLKRSRFYDGRRDVYASTKAAIKYLSKLHRDFGDWLLAIAAYNCGEGTVGRAIRRNEAAGLPTDFWSLNLPQETRAYVPRLMAVARLFADSERYGISLKDLPNSAKYKPVKISNQLDLALAADAAGISLDKLYELNPGFKGQYADVEGSYHLYIPAEKKAAEFRQDVERLSGQRRSLASADSFDEGLPTEPGAFQTFRREFARKNAANESRAGNDASNEANASVQTRGDSRDYRRGEGSQGRADEDAASTSSRRHGQEGGGRKQEVSVLRGETLYSVARKHGLDVHELARMNGIPVTTRVEAGQRLVVSEASSPGISGRGGRSHDAERAHHGHRGHDNTETKASRAHQGRSDRWDVGKTKDRGQDASRHGSSGKNSPTSGAKKPTASKPTAKKAH